MSISIPVVETARLRLRGHGLADFPACTALWSDAEVTRYIGGRPFTAEETWARLLRYVGHWSLLGFGFWAIEEKATGAFVGELGLADFKRDIDPPIVVPEAGWVLLSAAQGKGYATEALRGALRWAQRETACIIDPQNAQSIRVAEKCGYREALRTQYKGSPVTVFVAPASRPEDS